MTRIHIPLFTFFYVFTSSLENMLLLYRKSIDCSRHFIIRVVCFILYIIKPREKLEFSPPSPAVLMQHSRLIFSFPTSRSESSYYGCSLLHCMQYRIQIGSKAVSVHHIKFSPKLRIVSTIGQVRTSEIFPFEITYLKNAGGEQKFNSL